MRDPRERLYDAADHELSEGEIEERYGGLIEGALQGLHAEPDYLIDMMRNATLLNYQRERRAAKAESNRTGEPWEAILEARGVVRPPGVVRPARYAHLRDPWSAADTSSERPGAAQ